MSGEEWELRAREMEMTNNEEKDRYSFLKASLQA